MWECCLAECVGGPGIGDARLEESGCFRSEGDGGGACGGMGGDGALAFGDLL